MWYTWHCVDATVLCCFTVNSWNARHRFTPRQLIVCSPSFLKSLLSLRLVAETRLRFLPTSTLASERLNSSELSDDRLASSLQSLAGGRLPDAFELQVLL